MATLWSVILNRLDGASQVWKQWRANVVSTGPAEPGDIPMVGPGGIIDPSLLPTTLATLTTFGSSGPSTLTAAHGSTPAVLNIPVYSNGGSGGGGTFVQAEVDFGLDEVSSASTTITGQTWVTTDSVILCNPFAANTPDHSADEVVSEGLIAFAENLVPGVGFDVVAFAPNNTWGRYLINATGQ